MPFPRLDKLEDDRPEIKDQRFTASTSDLCERYVDGSLIREKLAFDMLRDAGLVAARAAFYRVYVDEGDGPVYWGLYTMVEDPSDALPSVHFPDGSGNVYKPDGTGADFTRFDARGFEKKNNDEADYGDVRSAIAALNASREDAASWRRRLEQTFDVDAFLGNNAVRMSIDHWEATASSRTTTTCAATPRAAAPGVLPLDHNSAWSRARAPASSPQAPAAAGRSSATP